jgi:phytoene dehydrogenase-like protein
MDYPRGGSGAVVDALVRGLSKYGGELRLRSAVAEVLVSEAPGGELGRCTGVRLAGGQVVHARLAVISNAPVWQTASLLPAAARDIVRSGATGSAPLDASTPPTPSFIHLHLGIRADGLSAQACPSAQ